MEGLAGDGPPPPTPSPHRGRGLPAQAPAAASSVGGLPAQAGPAAYSVGGLPAPAASASSPPSPSRGAGGDRGLHPLQQAFWDHHGLQCGYCTPGILIAALELLRDEPDPDEATIREALSGNLCICTGYVNVVRAVQAAAIALNGTSE
ncbi:MAG TPA: 2Fe-2S iron-sulfur cluster-binding protein [Chloroflexota bacterium]